MILARSLLAIGLVLGLHAPAQAAPRTLQAYLAQTGPAPDAHIAYGPAPSQYAELFTPPGKGPFPVVILVHGGCWQAGFGGIVEMRDLAGALKAQGVAVWNVEYRRVDEPGGGYPGMYEDMTAAMAALAKAAPAHHLNIRRVTAVGHSAGGQLVQWLGARGRLPASSPLYQAHPPISVREIISLGGLGDLRAQAEHIKTICEVDVAQLTGPASAARPDPFSDTSPAEHLPVGDHLVLINGEVERQSPPALATAYAAKARATGDRVETLVLPGAGHFDEVSTASPAWATILPLILKAVGKTPRT